MCCLELLTMARLAKCAIWTLGGDLKQCNFFCWMVSENWRLSGRHIVGVMTSSLWVWFNMSLMHRLHKGSTQEYHSCERKKWTLRNRGCDMWYGILSRVLNRQYWIKCFPGQNSQCVCYEMVETTQELCPFESNLTTRRATTGLL